MVVYQVISLGFDMDKAAAEVEALEKVKVEKEAREEEKRRCSHSPSDLFFSCVFFSHTSPIDHLVKRSAANIKQRGNRKNGKRHSSEDRTTEEEEVWLMANIIDILN